MSLAAASAAVGPRRLVVAIDGPASSGKSSVGAAAAERLGYRFFDTGLLYRAVTWLAIDRGVGDADTAGLVRLVEAVDLSPDERGRLSRVVVEGDEVSPAELHSAAVEGRVSAVAAIADVRAALVDRQRSIAAGGGIVMAGRDIGTVILPHADLKIFLDASVEERARRRAGERALDLSDPAGAAVLAALRRRDALDINRPVAPLRPAPDAVVIETDGNELEDTIRRVVATIQGAEARAAAKAGPKDGAAAGVQSVSQAADRSAASRMSRKTRPLPVSAIASSLTFLIRACSLAFRLLARIMARVVVEGDLAAIPRTGPLLVIANHASNADGVVVGAFLPPRIGRPFNWLSKREMFDVPILGWLAVRGGMHAVERTAVDLEAFRIAQRILDAGQVLAVFPEGTRSRTGALQEVKDGLAMLAQRSGVTIVPVGIEGSDLVWPRGRILPRFGGRIIVRVGPPFRLPSVAPHAGASRREAKSAATREMMGRIAALLPARQRGAYGPGMAHESISARAREATPTAS